MGAGESLVNPSHTLKLFGHFNTSRLDNQKELIDPGASWGFSQREPPS
jgi:hypothetical protein